MGNFKGSKKFFRLLPIRYTSRALSCPKEVLPGHPFGIRVCLVYGGSKRYNRKNIHLYNEHKESGKIGAKLSFFHRIITIHSRNIHKSGWKPYLMNFPVVSPEFDGYWKSKTCGLKWYSDRWYETNRTENRKLRRGFFIIHQFLWIPGVRCSVFLSFPKRGFHQWKR